MYYLKISKYCLTKFSRNQNVSRTCFSIPPILFLISLRVREVEFMSSKLVWRYNPVKSQKAQLQYVYFISSHFIFFSQNQFIYYLKISKYCLTNFSRNQWVSRTRFSIPPILFLISLRVREVDLMSVVAP